MPYKSDKQRRYMWSQHPKIAKKWAEKGEGHVAGKKKKKSKKRGMQSHLRKRY